MAQVPTPTDEAIARAPAEEPGSAAAGEVPATAAEPDEDLQPPALIVRLRAPDRAVARIIGAITPEHARQGAAVTFGISPQGRLAERAALADMVEADAPRNVLSLPHPRVDRLPTRITTTTGFDAQSSSMSLSPLESDSDP
jgi:hypothetical protein